MQDTLDSLISAAARDLPGDSPRLDAEVLMCHLLGCARSHLHAWPEQRLDEDQLRGWQALLQRRMRGEPLAWITGEREFWSLPLEVGPGVLIPRPETELLVELALERLPPWPSRVVDLGTGSGAIALALASERPDCEVTAVERDPRALEIARSNATRLGLEIVFLQGDWFAPLAGETFTMIVSNPPYVRSDDPHLQQGDLRFEPVDALVAGQDGLDAIRHIIAAAQAHLAPGGWLLLEHGYDQGPAVAGLLRQAGYADVVTFDDLAGRPRVSAGRSGSL